MNEILKKLTAAKGPTKGMVMLYPVADGVLFKVKVDGIDFENGKVVARVVPADGVGKLLVDPEKLVDNTDAQRKIYFRRYEAQQFQRNAYFSRRSVVSMRIQFPRLLDELTKPQRTKMEAVIGGVPYSKMTEYDLRGLFNQLVNIKFDIPDDGECE